MRLTSTMKGRPHHITIPDHDALKVGTLSGIVSEVAGYLEMEPADFAAELFG